MTSGSMAQFFNVLFPLARLAAIKIFCVAPDENWICDRIAQEWYETYSKISTKNIYDADVGLCGSVYYKKSAADKWHRADWRQFVRDLYDSDSLVRRF